MIQLGNKVRDTITGFRGVATGRTEWLYGCVQIGIDLEELDKDGNPVPTQWFDEQRLEVDVESKPEVSADSSARTGGLMADPSPTRAGEGR